MINFKCYKIILILLSPLGVSLGTYAGVQGALPGEFSVSSTLKVHFSQGNFQYQPSTHKCRFGGNQYDMIGSANSNLDVNTTSSYSGWIDLFGWGTGDNPGKNSSDYTNYTVFTDWGINPITNGGNKANLWRTLSVSEWEYLLSVRTNASSKRSIAKINGKAGFILLPDAWTLPDGVIFHANAGNYDTNVYTITEWSKMEANGAVFFPAAGRRNGNTAAITFVNSIGQYRTTAKSTYIGCSSSGEIEPKPNNGYLASSGMSVRLVQDINENTITFNANGGLIPTNGNMGNTPAGQITTLSADRKSGTVVVTKDKTYFQIMANDCPARVGYTFAGWYTNTTSGVQVYDNTGYRVVGTYWNSEGKWIGTSNVTLYAHWTPIPYTITVNSSNVFQGTAAGGGTYDYGTNHQITATPNECYQFTQWSDGNTDNPRTIIVTGDATYTAEFEKIKYTITWKDDDGSTIAIQQVNCGEPATPPIVDVPNCMSLSWDKDYSNISGDMIITAIWAIQSGALNGVFSVGNGKKVYFSQGNLQYQASTDTWRFAEHQYDTIGSANKNVSDTYNGWIDLFGYGTGDSPTKTSQNNNDYNTFVDWGKNRIINGGNELSLWRTLTYDEWMAMISLHYLGSIRIYSSATKSQSSRICWGYIFKPDDWTRPAGISDISDVTISEWEILEESGIILLVPTGLRVGTNYRNDLTDAGFYWLQSSPYCIHLNPSSFPNPQSVTLSYGRAVRLVIDECLHDIEKYVVSVSGTNGIVDGGGSYFKNTIINLTATPNTCYRFVQWSDGNTDNPRTIIVTNDATYTAEFEKIQYTIEAQPANPSQGSATVTNP